jgi:hypothetical protein
MDLDMVLNELSLRSPAQDVYIARQQMSEILRTMRMAIKSGVNRVLRTHENFYAELLAPGYSIANWRNDANVDREERRYFSSLATKAPYWRDLQDLETKNAYEVSEFRHHGVQADGLGFAYLLEALAVSLCSGDQWDVSRLELEASFLEDDTSISTAHVTVVHASKVDHVREHTGWIEDRLRTSVRDGRDLWARRDSLFPSLQFCDAVGDQLQSLTAGNPLLRRVVRRCQEFEQYCQTWEAGPFDARRLPQKPLPKARRPYSNSAANGLFAALMEKNGFSVGMSDLPQMHGESIFALSLKRERS